MVRRRFAHNFIRLHTYLTSAMSGRLMLYTFALIMLLAGVLMGITMLMGRFSSVEKSTADNLSLQLSIFEQDLVTHFDSVAARGIKLSKSLTNDLEEWLEKKGIAFSEINGNPDALAELQAALYFTLYNALELTECSGAYFLLDATANLDLLGADNSKAGMYLRLININVTRPVNPQLALYRGYTTTHRSLRHTLHNMWALELNTNMFPNYETLMENANPDLNSCFLFSDQIDLPGTWEKVMLLSVPLVDSNGNVYGICGFEISELYFKLHYTFPSRERNLTRLMAPGSVSIIDASKGFKSGDRTGYFLDLNQSLFIKDGTSFSFYNSEEFAMVGLNSSLHLSPLEEGRQIAVLWPKEDYDRVSREFMRENVAILILLILVAVFGSMFMSKAYVAPILRGLSQAHSDARAGDKVNIQEIDDLLDFLSMRDEARQEEHLALQKKLKSLGKLVNRESVDLPSRDAYQEFLKSLTTLTNAEREVFDLYMQGYRAKDMPDILYRSINTIKTHNKRIYVKLGVSSRKELMGYVEMMRLEEYKQEADA